MVLEKTLESPLDCKEIQPVHSKGDQPWVFLVGMMLKLKLQYFGHLMRRVDSLEKTLMLGGIGYSFCLHAEPIKGLRMQVEAVEILLKLVREGH